MREGETRAQRQELGNARAPGRAGRPTENELTFATELRRLRQRAQLTLDALADASGVSARTIGGLERGQSLGPQRRTLLALAAGLGLDDAERSVLERLAEVGRPRPVTAPVGWGVPPRPVPDFAAPLASVLIGSSVPDTDELLDELYELGLLSQSENMRYGFHDLIRLFAGERLAAEETADERAALTEAMTDWLLEVTVAAGRWFEPDYGAAPADWRQPVDLSTPEAAAQWLQTEADNWFGAVRIAARRNRDRQVVDTAEALHWFSDHWQAWAHWHELFSMAADAAQRLGDAVAQATQLNYLSWAQVTRGEREQAASTALRATAIAERAGDTCQQAWGFQYAAKALASEDPAAALPYAQESERLFAQTRDWAGHVQALLAVGVILTSLARPREAIAKLWEALELARVPQSDAARQLIADVAQLSGGKYLATAYEAAGEDELAEDSYRCALAHAERADVPHQRADAEFRLARLLYRRGRPDEATAMLRAARARFTVIDDAARVAEADELLERWRRQQQQ